MPNQDDRKNNGKEAFVGQADRPAVGLHPDTPLSDLKVRDLRDLLGGVQQDFKIKSEKWEHPKGEKWEKCEKWEKIEHLKWELKDLREVVKVMPDHVVIDPKELLRNPDPIDQVIQHVSRLTERVEQLSEQMNTLQQKV